MKRTTVPKKQQIFLEESALARVLAVLYRYPTEEFSLSELAKAADVSKSSVSRLLDHIERFGIIQRIDKGIIYSIKANRDNFNFIKRKIVHNLMSIYDSSLVETLDEIYVHPRSIILFGSYRWGVDTADSDIDIAIELGEGQEYQSIRLPALEPLEHFLGRKIQVHLFSQEKTDGNLMMNIANGIMLAGFLEVTLGKKQDT